MIGCCCLFQQLGQGGPCVGIPRATNWLGSLTLVVMMACLLTGLPGCGPGDQPHLGPGGTAVVSLKLAFPQQSGTAGSPSTRISQLWATVEAWLPTATTAWARENVGNLSALRVTVTGEGIQSPIIAEKQVINPVSGDVVTFDLTVPSGTDRIFAVDGFKNQLIIFTGHSVPVTLTAGQAQPVDITLTDNTGTVTGTVSNGATSGATAAMTVQGTAFTTPITSNGTFTIEGLPRGAHSVLISAPGFISKDLSVVVPAGDTVSVGTVALAPIPPLSGSVTGTVINANTGEPLADRVIHVADDPENVARTRSNGTFTMEGLPPGPHTLQFNIVGFQDEARTVTVLAEQSVSVGIVQMRVRTFTGDLTGTVVNKTGDVGIAGATVTLTVDVTGAVFRTPTDGAGRFTFSAVPAGFVTITASALQFTSTTLLRQQVKEDRTASTGLIALVRDFTGTYVGQETRQSDQAQFQIKIVIVQTGTSATVSTFSEVGSPSAIPANPQESGPAEVTGDTFTFHFIESLNGAPFTDNLWTFNFSDQNTLHFTHHEVFLQPGDTRPPFDFEGFLPRQ